jgi:P27 family predicted phage terminase small subunit
MASQGRPKLPQHLKVIQGTDQQASEAMPVQQRGTPDMPRNLSADARPVWRHICGFLSDLEVLTKADLFCIEGLAETVADLRHIRQSLNSFDDGKPVYVTKDLKGNILYKPRPEMGMILSCNNAIMLWVQRLGLSPADRNKLTKIVDTETNPFSSL